MRFIKIISAIAAIHIVLLAFFVFKPTVRYFTSTCVSTVLIWGWVFAITQRKLWLIAVGWIVQLSIQSFAYRLWQAEQTDFEWPLAQFIALQYIVVLSLSSPSCEQSG